MIRNYPLVTCTILTYKKFQYFYDAVESVLMQDYPQIELIISDDASGDFPEKEIRQFIEKKKKDNLKNILIRINPENLGIVKHANVALKNSHGEYLIGLASDDKFYEISTMKKIVDKFIETDADILSCRRMYCMENDLTPIKIVPCDGMLPMIKKLDTPKKQFKTLAIRRYEEIFCGASLYYKREFLMQRGWFDESYRFVEDHIVCLQYIRTGKKVIFADDIISIYYRQGGISKNTPLLSQDDNRTYEVEIIPFLKCFNKIEQRHIVFISRKPKEYFGQSFKNKLLFILKYFDICILTRYQKWQDRLLSTYYK